MNNMRVPLKSNRTAYNLIVTNAVTALLSATEDSNWTSDEKWLIFFDLIPQKYQTHLNISSAIAGKL